MCNAQCSRGGFDKRGRVHLSRLVILFLLTVNGSSVQTNQVWTRFGQIQGLWSRSSRGRLVAQYLGIPYAEPPVGDLRFRSPQPWSRTWNDIYNATKDGSMCSQMDHNGNVVGSEDCLYLNIFVPVISEQERSNSKLPVMVYIHGGKYVSGSGNSHAYSPGYLLDQNIILVTINYRLSILGFFSTENRVSPGNYALKDALMALRWIHENIEAFQGDPNSVTLWGHSAGAATAHALALTKKTEGLFNKYIVHSGCIIGTPYRKPKHLVRNVSLEAARLLGCLPRQTNENTGSVIDDLSTKNSSTVPQESNGTTDANDYHEEREEEIMRCMRSVDAKRIVGVVKNFEIWLNNPCCTFGPTIEEESEDAILTLDPLVAMKTNQIRDIPSIISLVKDEGLAITIDILRDPDRQKELINNLEAYVPLLLGYQHRLHNTTAFMKIVEDFYFEGDIVKNILQNITELFGDGVMTWPSYQTLQHNTNLMNSSSYFSLFAYEGTFTTNLSSGSQTRYGIAHSDDLYYFFPAFQKTSPDQMLNSTGADQTMINIMTELWTSFAIKGVPETWGVPVWPDYKESRKFLQFGVGRDPEIVVKSDFLPERMAFWEKLSRNLSLNSMKPSSTQDQDSNTTTSAENDKSLFLLLSFFIAYLLLV